MTNTKDAGKCFTFLTDSTPTTLTTEFKIKFRNPFDTQDGRFRIFLHEPGMEILLVNQVD